MLTPCKDCGDRMVGCHSTCPKYGEFYIQNEKRKERMHQEAEYRNSTIERIMSRKKGKNVI